MWWPVPVTAQLRRRYIDTPDTLPHLNINQIQIPGAEESIMRFYAPCPAMHLAPTSCSIRCLSLDGCPSPPPCTSCPASSCANPVAREPGAFVVIVWSTNKPLAREDVVCPGTIHKPRFQVLLTLEESRDVAKLSLPFFFYGRILGFISNDQPLDACAFRAVP